MTLKPSQTHNVAFQPYGSDVNFDGGSLRDHSVKQKTRSIEMGDSTCKRRQMNFKWPLATTLLVLDSRCMKTPDESRRAFNDKEELVYFEGILRKMLVMSTIHEKLRVFNDQ
eukprot:scaffold121176_cov23-Cyclotella_meneghiniana.AAC.1